MSGDVNQVNQYNFENIKIGISPFFIFLKCSFTLVSKSLFFPFIYISPCNPCNWSDKCLYFGELLLQLATYAVCKMVTLSELFNYTHGSQTVSCPLCRRVKHMILYFTQDFSYCIIFYIIIPILALLLGLAIYFRYRYIYFKHT